MADEADKELKIRIVTAADTQSVEDYNSELRKLGYGIDENTGQTIRNTEAAVRSGEGHRELRRGIELLSQLIPGLGATGVLAAEGFQEMGESAAGAAEGIDALISTLGPIAVVILAIQAAIEYWDLYKEAVKGAEEAVTESSKKILEDSQKALDKFNELQDAINGVKRPERVFEDELKNAKALLDARQKVEDEKADARKQSELDAAGRNEEAKAEIERRYEGEAHVRKLAQAQEQIDLQKRVLAEAQQNVNVSQVHIEVLKELLGGLPASDLPGRLSYMGRIAQESDSAKKVQDFINGLQSEIGTESGVNAINRSGLADVNRIKDRSTFETGVRGLLGDFGPKLTGQQQEAEREVQQFFEAHRAHLDVWLGYLKQFNLTLPQKLRDIDAELRLLSERVSNMPTQTNR